MGLIHRRGGKKLSFVIKNRRVEITRRRIFLGFGVLVAWLTLVASNFDPIVAIF